MTKTDHLTDIIRKQVKPASPSKLRKYAQYLAGLMDGEGSFMIINRKDSLEFSPCIALTMTHKPTIEFAADIFGVDVSERLPKSKKHKIAYAAPVTTQENCLAICSALSTYAITKREPIRLLYEFLELWMDLPPCGQKRKEYLTKIVDKYIAIKQANHRGKKVNYETIRNRLLKQIAKEPSIRCFT
jgi:hypothetical protein